MAKVLVATLLYLSCVQAATAQDLLNRVITLNADRKPLGEALKMISTSGNFQFSYNSNLIPRDSIISLQVNKKTVRQTLDILFEGRFEYKETGQYIIIQHPSAGQTWYVSGYVMDERTGEKMRDVSVYEEHQLVATLTNAQGYFRLKLRDKYPKAAINIRKAWYTDTSMTLKTGYDQELTVRISPKEFDLDSVVVTPVDKNWLANIFLSSRQRIQSINLSKYFVEQPYQTSFTPGLGTHGRMSGQVVNKISFNILGGYAAGVDGVELGGIFNIVKNNMEFTQIAGVFNIVGGQVYGAQLAGVYNSVLDSVFGVQLAGVINISTGSLKGIQLSGVANHVSGTVEGVQLAGVANLTKDSTSGVQLAGVGNITAKQVKGVQLAGVSNIAMEGIKGVQLSGVGNIARTSAKGLQLAGVGNIAKDSMKGVQMAGMFNYARKMEGLQFAVVNIADSSSGYAIGLFNFIRNGYHKVAVSGNDMTLANLSIKTGTRKLYTALLAGISPINGSGAFTFGLGMGTDIRLGKFISLNPEISNQQIYLGSWQDQNMLSRLNLNICLRANRFISFYGGPSLCVYYEGQQEFPSGYQSMIPAQHMSLKLGNNDLSGWIGWNAGINFF